MDAGFDHEKLDVYRLSIELIAWVGTLIDERLAGARLSAVKHLDEASTSVSLNIAEGNGKRSAVDRARFLDIARGSALESAACLDVLVARKRLAPGRCAAWQGLPRARRVDADEADRAAHQPDEYEYEHEHEYDARC